MYKSKNSKVQKLLEHYREMSLLGNILAILGWDLNVNLPPKGSEARAHQISLIESLLVDKWLDPEFKFLLEEDIDEKTLNETDRAILRNLKIGGKYYFKVPKKLILEKSELTSKAYVIWSEAKKNNRFKDFQPLLQKLIETERLIAGHLEYKKNSYDALLDLYEPGLTYEFTDELFRSLQPTLTKLLNRITNSSVYKMSGNSMFEGKTYPIELQRKLADFVLNKMSYHFDEGRLDISSHPFTTELGRHDVRITTRYDLHDFRESLYSVVHEAGHGLYELGVDSNYANTPLAGGVSLGIHESQSRFWENQIGRNPLFVAYLQPVLHAMFPHEMEGVDINELSKYVNYVSKSLIRTKADEVTYTLHIILRFEIENDLINKKIDVKDLPDIWRSKMKSYLGVVPPTDREGVLQDVHWAHGSIGYFPTYALGNIYAAQFTNRMKKDISFDEDVRHGKLTKILQWLRKNVHIHGSLYMPNELVMRVTGEKLNPKYFIDYLEKKYSKLFIS